MRSARLLTPILMVSAIASAQPAPLPAPSAPLPNDADILAAPQEFRDFVVKETIPYHTWSAKTEGLARGIFGRKEDGGLGIVYANDKTRTVAEVWRDRKANCISLTAFYAAACRMLGGTVWFAEAPSVSLWVRHGDLIYNELHVVAAIPVNPLNTVVADFSPEIHNGAVHIRPVTEARFRAMFHSNRAIEILQDEGPEAAIPEAEAALRDDPQSGIGWNTYGVIQKAMNHPARAEEAFLRALAIDPKNGIACGNLEGIYKDMGRTEEAGRFRALGMELRDKDPYFHAFLAKEALDSGHVEDAVDQIKKALRLQKMEPDFYLILAQAELNRGRRDQAAEAVEKAVHWSLPAQMKRMESKLALIRQA